MTTGPQPTGYRTVAPYLVCREARRAMQFYSEAFGASERMRLTLSDGRIAHAELQIGDSVVMLAEEFPEWGAYCPQTLQGSPVSILIFVAQVDTVFQRAIDLGARVIKPVADQFYGDRSGHLEDPFGHRWSIATHVEDVPVEEMQRRLLSTAAESPG